MKSALAILSLGGALLAMATPAPGRLPAPLAAYRSWQAGRVHAVSPPLSILCVALPEEELVRRRAEAARAHGPHAERYLRVYANPRAAAAAREPGDQPFPAGSIIAKEKLAGPAATPEAVAFMIKEPPGTSPESGDWTFRFFPEPASASYTGCVECHRGGASRDYVFSRWKAAAPE